MRSDSPVCSGRSAAGFEKKRPAPTARTCTGKCELAAGRWPLATGYLAGGGAAAAIAVAALGATFAAALAAASAAAALS